MSRVINQALEILEGEGLTVTSIEKGNHHKLRARNVAGEARLFIVGSSPSDHRSWLNLRAEARRFSSYRRKS